MKLLPIFILVVAFLLWARRSNTPWLFFGWAFFVTGLPVMRGQLGPIPVYDFDVAVVLVWSIVLTRPGMRAWPAGAPPWLTLFLLMLGVFGTLLPMIEYGGIFPEMIWNFGHTGLALTTLVLGSFLVTGATEAERDGFRRGLLVALVVLAIIALLEKSSESINAALTQLFIGADDEGGEQVERTKAIAELISSGGRVAGPLGSPNTFGVVAVMAAVNYWFLSAIDRRKSIFGAVVFGSMTIVLFASGSRQALISAAFVGLGFLVMAPIRQSLPRILLAVGLVGIVSLFVDADIYLERLSRLSQGTDEANVAARLSDGPERFWEMMNGDPYLSLTGVGLEIQKLARLGIDVPADILYGFASNGFLLYIYYFGVFGFLVMTSFWAWVLVKGARAPKELRRITLGTGVALPFIVFADNHAVLAEELVTQMMVFAGLLTAVSARAFSASRPPPLRSAFQEQNHASRAGQ